MDPIDEFRDRRSKVPSPSGANSQSLLRIDRDISDKPVRAMYRFAIFISLAALAAAQNPPALKPGLYAIFNTAQGAITAMLYEK